MPATDGRQEATITATRWLAQGELSVDAWVSQGRRLAFIGKGVAWWIGDWLRYGNLRWGERYARAARITGYDTQTLMNMVYVASAYPPEERRDGLSWSHHAELAGLNPAERTRWMDLAEQQRMSVQCLRTELRRVRRLQAGECPVPEPPAGEASAAAAAPNGEAPRCCPRCGFAIGHPGHEREPASPEPAQRRSPPADRRRVLPPDRPTVLSAGRSAARPDERRVRAAAGAAS